MTRMTSRGPDSGRSLASSWFKAPAFFSVFPIVSTTSTPRARTSAMVPSVQLSAITSTRSGRRSWSSREASVAPITASSLCAGMSTVHRSGVPAGSSSIARPDSDTGRTSPRARAWCLARTCMAAAASRAAIPVSTDAARNTAARASFSCGTSTWTLSGTRAGSSAGRAPRRSRITATTKRTNARTAKPTASAPIRATRTRYGVGARLTGHLPSSRETSPRRPIRPELSSRRHARAAVYTVQPRPAPSAGSGRRLDPWPRHGSAASAGTTTIGNPARRIRTSRSVSDATRSATQWARARV